MPDMSSTERNDMLDVSLSLSKEVICDGTVRDCVCRYEVANPNNCATSADCDDEGEVCIGIMDEAPMNRVCESTLGFDQLKLQMDDRQFDKD